MRDASPETTGGTHAPPRDIPLPWRSHLILASAGVVAFGLFQALSAAPGIVETGFATTVNPLLTRLSSRVTGIVRFPILEPLVLVYGGRLILLGIGGAVDLVRRRRRVMNVLGHGLLRVARDAGLAVVLFYLMWGFNYARSPLRDRLGWDAFRTPETAELARLASAAVDGANAAYFAIHDSSDADAPTVLHDVRAVDRALETGWERATGTLSLDHYMAKPYGRVKQLLSTPIVSRLGISGFYFPWTTEANVLRGSPGVFQPHSMAHEKAHQRGIGPEEEASFLGYVVAVNAPDPYARYSAHVFAQLQLLRVLGSVDIDLARSVASQRSPGVDRDINAAADYWARRRGVATEVGQAVNHQFLRANRVHGGIASYRQSVRLIITFLQQPAPATR